MKYKIFFVVFILIILLLTFIIYKEYTPPELISMGKLNNETAILYPENAESYIMPENKIVQLYAKSTVLTNDGLVWKIINSDVKFVYEDDNTLFNNPPSGDMWQNPDYYLTHGRIGDCEDFSVAFASILKAKGIPAEVVGVRLINDKVHWVVRYYFNEHTVFADINRNEVIIYHDINPTISKEIIVIGEINDTV